MTHPLTQHRYRWNNVFQGDTLKNTWRSIHGAQTRRHTGHVDAGEQQKFNGRHAYSDHEIGQQSFSFNRCAQDENETQVQKSAEKVKRMVVFFFIYYSPRLSQAMRIRHET